MKITKREVLKAIRTEKLKGRGFIHAREIDCFGQIYKIYDSKCKVCAVGAVLRHKRIPDHKIKDMALTVTYNNNNSESGHEFESLKAGDYLGALSIKFEKLYARLGGGKKTKETLARFVKRYFPKTFTA